MIGKARIDAQIRDVPKKIFFPKDWICLSILVFKTKINTVKQKLLIREIEQSV